MWPMKIIDIEQICTKENAVKYIFKFERLWGDVQWNDLDLGLSRRFYTRATGDEPEIRRKEGVAGQLLGYVDTSIDYSYIDNHRYLFDMFFWHEANLRDLGKCLPSATASGSCP